MTTANDECNCGNARGHMTHDPACPAAPPADRNQPAATGKRRAVEELEAKARAALLGFAFDGPPGVHLAAVRALAPIITDALCSARFEALKEAAMVAEECSFREAEWPEFFYDEMVQCGLSEARRITVAAIRALWD